MYSLQFVLVTLALTIPLGAHAPEQVTLATGKIRRYIDIGLLNRGR